MKEHIERIIKDLAYDNFVIFPEMYPINNGETTKEALYNLRDLASNYYENRTNNEISRDEQYGITEKHYHDWCLNAFENHSGIKISVRNNLTIEQKIKILKSIDFEWTERVDGGLCNGIAKAYDLVIGESFFKRYFSIIQVGELIELFTLDNAQKFEASPLYNPYWFPNTPEGYKQRRKFRNWMVSEYKKQL